VLELGPGTGQATEPVLNTGCDYHAIELGGNLCRKMQEKFGSRSNFHITNDDFITHSFGTETFDLIYSAATIQWIPEEIAFSKTFELLKPGGTLAMLLTRSDYATPDPALYARIQQVYRQHFHPETSYPCRGFGYTNAPDYGYEAFEKREYQKSRFFTADEYVGYCSTHCDHIDLKEPDRSLFFGGIRQAVLEAGNRLESIETHVLYLAKKPQ
jgi:SAM-dependent methyltransferase